MSRYLFLCHVHHRRSLPLSLLFVLFPGFSAWTRGPPSSPAKAASSCQAAEGESFSQSEGHAVACDPLFSWQHGTSSCRSVLLYMTYSLIVIQTLIDHRSETLVVYLSQVFEVEPARRVAQCLGAPRCAWGRGCWWSVRELVWCSSTGKPTLLQVSC